MIIVAVITAVKFLIIAAGSILLIVEEFRKHTTINKILIVFAFFLLVKDFGSVALYYFFGESIVKENFFYYYLLYWLPTFTFFYFIHRHFLKKQRNFYVPGTILAALVVISALVFQFHSEFIDPGYLFLVLLGVRSLLFVAAILSLIQINTVYLADRHGVLIDSLPLINTLYVLLSVNFWIISTPKNPFFALMEIIAYSSVFILFYRKNHYGYEELQAVIKENEKELNSILNLMNKSGVGAGHVNDFNEITDSILQYVCEMVGAKAGILLTTTSDKNYLLPRGFYGVFPPLNAGESYAAVKKQYLETFNRQVKLKVGENYIGKAAQTMQSHFYRNAQEYPELVEQSSVVVIESLIVHPLLYRDELLGAIAFCNKEDSKLFTEEEYHLSSTLAQHVSIIMNNFRFYNELIRRQKDERELEIAGTIQKNLLPSKIPANQYVEIFTFTRPAKDVGGDYYNVINVDERRLDVLIADVAGKGVPASLVMVMISTVLKNIIKSNYGPRRIISFLNRFLCRESTMERYATLSYVSINVMDNTLQFTNSGHSPLMLYKSETETFEHIDTPGIPLGIDADQNYIQKHSPFQSGDIFTIYTDGITEAMNEKSDMFGIDRVCNAIKKFSNESAQEIGDRILDEIEKFTASAEQHDDMTLIIVKKL
jgi:sigma-B regulation protein RsbU (phosphoserine phosphatase)